MVANLTSIIRIPILILSVSVLLCACEDNAPEIIEPEQFAELYVDMVMTTIDSMRADSTNIQKRILAEHDVSQAEFEDTMAHYYNHPMLWLDVFTKVNDKLEKRIRPEK